jgi:hypothetical protein
MRDRLDAWTRCSYLRVNLSACPLLVRDHDAGSG